LQTFTFHHSIFFTLNTPPLMHKKLRGLCKRHANKFQIHYASDIGNMAYVRRKSLTYLPKQ